MRRDLKDHVHIERAYDPPEPGRRRVLVDRLWPRGVSKERAALDEWCKDVAPSTELRKWYDHAVDRFEEFSSRYQDELRHGDAGAAVERLRSAAQTGELALVTATRDIEHSGAVVLREFLLGGAGI
ncbi:MAG: DUF488 family protein [Acidimicrobiales bacterium]